jgi:hypothetical protein
MPAEPFIVYDPPYGGQAVRGKRVADAWVKVAAFLESCTDRQPLRPLSLDLDLLESGGPAAAKWRLAALEQASARFGSGTRRAWATGAREEYKVEWRLEPAQLGQALALLTSWEPMPKAEIGPADLRIYFRFRWIDLETRTVLPGQREDQRAHPSQAESDLMVSLGARSSAILNARLPFQGPNPNFVAYVRALVPLVPFRLNTARLRHWIPTRKGDGLGYRRLRLAVNLET